MHSAHDGPRLVGLTPTTARSCPFLQYALIIMSFLDMSIGGRGGAPRGQ